MASFFSYIFTFFSAIRIVSLAPNITEILFALHAQEHIVAVTDFCDYPAEAKALPKVGGILNFNYEKIYSFHPDLILMKETQNPTIKQNFRKMGILFREFRFETLEDIEKGLKELAQIVGKEKDAEIYEKKIRWIRKKRIPPNLARVVFLMHRESDFSSLWVAGQKSFIGELLMRAGGISPECPQFYCSFSLEALVKFRPEMILEYQPDDKKGEKQVRKEWRKFHFLPAVKSGKILILRDARYLRPSHRVIESFKDFVQWLSPLP